MHILKPPLGHYKLILVVLYFDPVVILVMFRYWSTNVWDRKRFDGVALYETSQETSVTSKSWIASG